MKKAIFKKCKYNDDKVCTYFSTIKKPYYCTGNTVFCKDHTILNLPTKK